MWQWMSMVGLPSRVIPALPKPAGKMSQPPRLGTPKVPAVDVRNSL